MLGNVSTLCLTGTVDAAGKCWRLTLLYLAGASSLQATGRAGVTCVEGFWMPKTTSMWVFLLVLGWVFFSGKLCKAELDSAGRLLVAGLKCFLELQILVGLVPAVVLPAKGFC